MKIMTRLSFFGLILALTFPSPSEECPEVCKCLGTTVACRSKELDSIPIGFPMDKEILELQGNRLSIGNISYLLKTNENIEALHLDKNGLDRIPLLVMSSTLRLLSLTHNKIMTIEEEIWQLAPNLRALNLSNNLIMELRARMFPPSQLSFLNFNNNRITRIENTTFDNLERLISLKLSGNDLEFLDKKMFQNLTNLKFLEFEGNSVYKIEGLTFKSLVGLKVLKMRRNQLREIHDGAFYVNDLGGNLTVIRLNRNNLQEVRKGWIYGLKKLQELHLGRNRIYHIQKSSWESASKSLTYLDLSYNDLRRVTSSSFEHLKKLQRLTLSHNEIELIQEGAFNSTPSLMQLDLSYNNLSYVIEGTSGAFQGLSQLLKLNLAANQIKSISSKTFIGLDSLTELNLTSNNIAVIHENPFVGMKLTKLTIKTTSLLCDCSHAWLPDWATNFSIDISYVSCDYPESHKNKPINALSRDSFVCHDNDRPQPTITENPKSEVIKAGSSVELQCSASSSSSSPLQFIWKRNNIVLSRTTASAQNNTSIYLLLNVSPSDAGKYQCIASNKFGTAYSSVANLSVLVLPKMLKRPANVTVAAGQTAKFECSAEGEPPPQIGWQKDGGTEFPAAQERRMHVMPTDDVFFISNTRPSDSGVYSCTANNSAGVVVANATLTVHEKPAFIKKMEDKEVELGNSVVLECLTSGWPKPKIRWFKDGCPITTTSRFYFAAYDQLFIIVDVNHNDEGTYQCEVTNSLGKERGNAQLRISQKYGRHEDMTGVIIITGVCCAVGTSAIWVIIIYHTQKQLRSSTRPRVSFKTYLDTKSEHSASSKDSGTGDSTKRSAEDIRVVPGTCIHDFTGETEINGELNVPLLNMFPPRREAPSSPHAHGTNSNVKIRENNLSNHDRCKRPCSTPLSKSSASLNSIPPSSSYLCLYTSSKPTPL